jgi:hypothetical protein
MTTADGMSAAPAAMTEAAEGIAAVVAELGSVGDVYRASAGVGLTDLVLKLNEATIGHAALANALGGFAVRWEWGVRSLVRKADDISEKLAAAGSQYKQSENSLASFLNRVRFDLEGDPTGDSSKAGDAPAAAQVDPREFAPEAVDRELGEMGETWSKTIDGAVESSVPGTIARALSGGDPLESVQKDAKALSEIWS